MNKEATPETNTMKNKLPLPKTARWTRRVSNVIFIAMSLYLVYLLMMMGMAYFNNTKLAGQKLGTYPLEIIQEVTPGVVAELNQNSERQVLVMWATWCGPCHSLLTSLAKEVKEGTLDPQRVVAVSMVETEETVRKYLEKTPLPFNIALDEKGVLARRLNVSGTPTVVFLNRNGEIKSVTTGGFGLASKSVSFLKEG